MDADDALYVYLMGLESDTSKQVRLRRPTSISVAITETTIVHSILFPGGFPKDQPSARTAPQASVDPMAMELDNMRLEINALRSALRGSGNTSSLTPLTAAERQRLRLRGGCFKCRRDGHMARECPNRSLNNLLVTEDAYQLRSGNAPSNK
ncbi:hypothetical protein BGZ98_002726, partial [Dissophora globulifera]